MYILRISFNQFVRVTLPSNNIVNLSAFSLVLFVQTLMFRHIISHCSHVTLLFIQYIQYTVMQS